MRMFLVLAVAVAAVAGVMTRGQRGQSDAPPAQAVVAQPTAAASAEPSEHNWPKRALNRAADVKRQVADQRKEDAVR